MFSFFIYGCIGNSSTDNKRAVTKVASLQFPRKNTKLSYISEIGKM